MHYVLAPPLKHIDALLPLLYRLIQNHTDPSGDHVCPVCGQVMLIDFSEVELSIDPLVISTFCKTCNIYLTFRSNKIPPWVISWTDKPGVREFLAELQKRGDQNA